MTDIRLRNVIGRVMTGIECNVPVTIGLAHALLEIVIGLGIHQTTLDKTPTVDRGEELLEDVYLVHVLIIQPREATCKGLGWKLGIRKVCYYKGLG